MKPTLDRAQMHPMAEMPLARIPLSVPMLGGHAWEYLKECLDTNWVSSVGPFVTRFEQMAAQIVGAQYGVATASGTAALHMALLVAGVQPDDEVLMPALSFIAPANAVRYVGAWPVFIDAEPTTWQIDPAHVTQYVTQHCTARGGALYSRATGRRLRAILPVHVLGHPCDMDPIIEIARAHQLTVIEDAAESLGATYKERPTGCLGDIACLSFNGNKVVTAGGGGMMVTNRQAWAERAKYLTTQAKDDATESIHAAIGFNYRLTNLQAALGCAQLEQLDAHLQAKRRIAATYGAAFSRVQGVTPMPEAGWASSSCWLYTMLVDEQTAGLSSRSLLRRLAAARIDTRPLWQPLHQSPAHRRAAPLGGAVAERLYRQALSLPSSVGLTAAEQQRVIDQVLEHVS